MQETGRFAVSLLSEDLMRQGYFGDLVVPISRSNLRTPYMGAPTNECVGEGLNNGTFPGDLGTFRTLWGLSSVNATPISCIDDASIGSDVLQLKRTITSPFTGAQSTSRYYLYTNSVEGQIIVGGTLPAPVINDAQVYEYQHHIYYVTEESRGAKKYPVLKMKSLATTVSEMPLIDGVERIRFLYGVDTDLDGIVNTYLSATEMNATGSGTGRYWDNADTRIMAVKIYVLVRDLEEDTDYSNTNDYFLGNDVAGKYSVNDNYRRMLFSSTISLFNGDVKVWD
ncbi:PilW family protein [Thalassotalea euphylliae]|uniref:PilW family protein n=1 Tax=Thalassotalea euphylliae TaxID=1655234 RepID=UPI00363262D5